MSLEEFLSEKARLGLIIVGPRIDLEILEKELRARKDIKVAFSYITSKPLVLFECREVVGKRGA